MRFALHLLHAGQAHEGVQIGLAQLRGHGHGGDVAAADQRVLRGQGAGEAVIKIFGLVGAERGRCILEDGLGMQQALIQCEGIDEGLERRARRAPALRAVDLAFDLVVVPVRGADECAHLHRRGVEQQGAGVDQADIGARAQVLLQDALHGGLHAQVDGAADVLRAAVLGEQHVGQVRRAKRQVAARLGGQHQLGVGREIARGGVALGPES